MCCFASEPEPTEAMAACVGKAASGLEVPFSWLLADVFTQSDAAS